MVEAGINRSASLPAIAQRGRTNGATAHPREQFLAGLLNEDLQTITQWHGSRPPHEQKRFLRSVNTLYKAFESADNGSMAEKARKLENDRKKEQNKAAAARGDGGVGSAGGSVGSGGGRSTSAALGKTMPDLKPIDIFAETKKMELRRKQNPDEDPNTLLNWLDGQSMTSGSTADGIHTDDQILAAHRNVQRIDLFRVLRCTDDKPVPFPVPQAGICTEPEQVESSKSNEAGNLKDGIPTIGFPETERMMTQFKEAFGDVNLQGANITKEMYQSVLKSNSHPFVRQFLDSADPKEKERFADMVRCLEYLRKSGTSRNMSLQKEEMNLAENRRLFNPSRQRPMFDTSEINISKVPIGNLPTGKKPVSVAPPQVMPDLHPHPPSSPAVS
eukprot:CAMPEP_0206578722 /NCGR_PEP_ID=MMETSP0325_2-20121206/32127_1 /ASSEMBLY_ACC=CAM_ASM_000347 /TAXON_ID=2866 /ORGANISM="Crypthecodinium cohnii, Strain Seligo" /LENGTH=386 /DNA_ID=CAMNT_0054084405 /DNA_START=109 /DNA_END=1267 /DNA_ORIENTATION=+